jgi:hypothetical protein
MTQREERSAPHRQTVLGRTTAVQRTCQPRIKDVPALSYRELVQRWIAA